MLLWLSISSTFAAIAFMVDIIIGGRFPVAWLRHGYEDPRIKDLGIGTEGAYDLVLRRRAAGGWAPRRLVVLRGEKFEPAHRQELAALAVVPADAAWHIDPNFLAPGKALLRFDAKDDQVAAHGEAIAQIRDGLLEVRAATLSWLDFVRSAGSPE